MNQDSDKDWWLTDAVVEMFCYCCDDAGASGCPITAESHLPIPERVGNHFILGMDFKEQNGSQLDMVHRSRIIMMPVESSNITHVGVDTALRHVYVLFCNRSLYMYSDVNYDQACGLLNSQSVGKFLNVNIKESKEYRKLLP